MCANCTSCSGLRVRVRARVDEDAATALRRDRRSRSPGDARPGAGGCAGATPRASRPCSRPRRPPPPPRPRPRAPRGRATSRASTAPIRPHGRPCRSTRTSRRARDRRSRGSPGRRERAGCRARLPRTRRATISSGARSPPSASTATRITREDLRRVEAERLDVPALVRLAVRADAMHPLRLLAGRADLDVRGGERVLGAALVAPRPGCLSLRDGHERLGTIAAASALSSARSARESAGRARRRRAFPRSRRARSRAARRLRDRGGSSARRGPAG